MRARGAARSLPRYVKLWFYLDIVLALAPPAYWLADKPQVRPFGVPISLIYFITTALFISLSIVCAYLSDPETSERGQ